jgi:tetratricopeptide (TPR) repeat protein
MISMQPLRPSRRSTLVVRGLVAAGVVVALACRRSNAVRAPAIQAVPVLSESEKRELDIEFYQARASADPAGATDLARLASLYLQRSRDTGDPRDAARAEGAARRSLHNRRAHNDQAAQVLASSLLAQHRFDEALVVAGELRDDDPASASRRAAVAEIEMEMGQYDSARVAFDSLATSRNDLSVAPRLARWAEIEGRPDEARRLMRHALALARHAAWLPSEQVAWFWLRSGDIEFRMGHFAAADSAYAQGLAAHPDDYRVLAAMSRLAATRHDWPAAIDFGNRAIASSLDPATLGTLSDAYEAMGDTARAAELARALDVAVRSQPGAYHRAWSLFLLDHHRQLGTVHRKIVAELRTRRDVYAYDLYAWSLHTQGRDAEALRASHRALAEGTQDAQLLYHASVIERATGHAAEASEHLTRARTLNPSLQ